MQQSNLFLFFLIQGGQVLPNASVTEPRLYPKAFPGHDRIPEQLMYLPLGNDNPDTKPKTILLWNGLSSWESLPIGREVFQIENCPVKNCEILTDRDHAGEKTRFTYFLKVS